MPLYRFLIACVLVCLFSILQPASAQAGELYGWVGRRYYGPTPFYVGNPRGIEPGKAFPTLHNDSNPHAYPYGYFGAQYRPYTVTQRNYYHDYDQWSFRRGY
jgi:hypothetical protein